MSSIVQDLNVFGPRVLRALRARSRLLVGQIASATPSTVELAPYDLLVTSFPHFVRLFRASGIESEYFRIGFDPRVLPIDREPDQGRSDAVFVGALGRSRRGDRMPSLERAAERVPIDFWGYRVGRRPLGERSPASLPR